MGRNLNMTSRPKSLRWLERLSFPIELISTVIGLVAVWYFTDIPLIALGGAGIGFGLAYLWRFLKRQYGLNNGWGKLPAGFGLLALGIYAFTYPAGAGIFKAGFVLAGAWLTLDAIYDLRTGVGTNAPGTPNTMKQFGDASIVGRALEDEPRSIAELEITLELSRNRIENALDILVDADAIVKRNDDYYATLEDQSISEVLRDTPSQFTDRLGGVPARLLRPFRLFDN